MTKETTKKLITCILSKVFVFATFLLLVAACGEKDSSDNVELVGNWIELSDFERVPRSDAVAFSIGDKGYVGTGYDGSDRLNDFWEYDPSRNQWRRKADFPGGSRNGAVGFGTDTKGYMGTGYDGANRLKDFYEYDPATNTWTQISDFAGTARYGAVAFVIDGKGYVGTGVDNGVYEDDFWEYDPVANNWNRKRDIINISDEDYDDDYSNITGTNKVAFSVNRKGYVATGGAGTAGTSVWGYNPVSDLWERKTELEASARIEGVGFSIGNLGYITTGRSASFYLDDIWGFDADAEQVDLDKSGAILSPQ